MLIKDLNSNAESLYHFIRLDNTQRNVEIYKTSCQNIYTILQLQFTTYIECFFFNIYVFKKKFY